MVQLNHMVSRLFKLAGVGLGLMLLAVSLPLYAQASPETEVVNQTASDREASVVCMRAQTKLNDYLTNLEEFKSTQLDANRSILAFVNNISLRLEHNNQVEKNSLGDDVTRLNELITDQEVAYTQLQSSLRTAVSVSYSSSSDVDALRSDVSNIRDNIAKINSIQIEFDDYISDTVVDNLEEVQKQIDQETPETDGANT